jgi:hypothetical protein
MSERLLLSSQHVLHPPDHERNEPPTPPIRRPKQMLSFDY